MKPLLLALAATVMVGANNFAAETRFQSGPTRTSLIELYTSEGCSSCPPAEAWLSRLKDNPGLWKNFVPLAFHVDYWDRLGWRDRFSSKQWTERQRQYAAQWRSESVYTPAVVMNGREERGWLGMKFGAPNDRQSGDLNVSTSDGKTFAIEFRPVDGLPSAYEAHLALLGSGISTSVRAGENSGRNLVHDFVVLDLQTVGLKSGAGSNRASLTTSATTEAGARKAIAIWVTPRGQLFPLQATGGWLP
ncbi:MAG: DUF1223 domain-containing protein [Verrucomicrobiota bacterium]|nr:DUF1223 domain-containing protein [Chthoniobacterales bacterium]MDQ3414437.1 DUF1223 domain-containing protein [Verrucomicrobiota bacterium]